MMGEHGVGDDGGKLAAFCNFHRLVINGTLYEHRVYHKGSWVSTELERTSNQIDRIAITNRFTGYLQALNELGTVTMTSVLFSS